MDHQFQPCHRLPRLKLSFFFVLNLSLVWILVACVKPLCLEYNREFIL